MRELTYTDAEVAALRRMLEAVESGRGVLVAGNIHPDLPALESVGPGRLINTVGPVDHIGYGCFAADMGTGRHDRLTFDGGGWMSRTESFSWTFIGGPIQRTGYPFAKVAAALKALLAAAPESRAGAESEAGNG